MLNLKTIKIHTIKAHLDRLQNTAAELATWSAGEVMAGRLGSAQETARIAAGLLNTAEAIRTHTEKIRGSEPTEN
jgi:hypothetical protein